MRAREWGYELGAYYSRASRTDLAREFIKQPFVRIPTLGRTGVCALFMEISRAVATPELFPSVHSAGGRMAWRTPREVDEGGGILRENLMRPASYKHSNIIVPRVHFVPIT